MVRVERCGPHTDWFRLTIRDVSDLVSDSKLSRLCELNANVNCPIQVLFSPRLTSTWLAPLLIFSKPSLAMALARMVAAVVPSPASSFVLFATSCTNLAPTFCSLSFRSMAFATVTPSFVILGLPQLCSRITFRPCNDQGDLMSLDEETKCLDYTGNVTSPQIVNREGK